MAGDNNNNNSNNNAHSGDNDAKDAAKAAGLGAAAGAGIGGLCWGVAVPVVNSVGFGTGGIAANSFAAGMMSTAAVANGGGVAAGSTVAMLQSIGAVGLATPVGLGLVVGGAVVIGGGALIAKLAISSRTSDDKSTDGDGKPLGASVWIVVEAANDAEKPTAAIFETEDNARATYDASTAATKALFGPDKKLVLTSGWQERLRAFVADL